MKKFLTFLIIVGGLGAAGYYFYDPYLKPYFEPLLEEVTGTVDAAIGNEKDRIINKDGGKTVPEPKAEPEKTRPAPAAKAKPAAPVEPENAAPSLSEIEKIVIAKYPMPNVLPLLEIVDHWNHVPKNAFPKFVTLKDKLAFTMTINGNRMASVAVPGTEVVPTRLNGRTLYVTSAANAAMQNKIDVDKTDFKDRIAKRYADFMAAKRTQIRTLRLKAKRALEASPEKFAALRASEGKWDETGDPRFGPVKASIAGGQVNAVTLKEATSFRWNGSERVGGELAGSYDTVTVHFEVSTIFGKFPTDYKCLLRAGKVVGWIDPVTDEKI